MFSPKRKEDEMLTTPERVTASPLRAMASPFYEAVKSAHSRATRDFDRFYENLQATLSPRTSESRVRKQTPETTERIRRAKLNRGCSDSTRTSLTPLIERHTLREDPRTKYQYRSRNPFFQDETDSEIEDTPSLSERDDDTPYTIKSKPTPLRKETSYQHKEMTTTDDESKRLDNLLNKLTKIRRQASLLADEITTADINEEEEFTILSEPVREPIKEPIVYRKKALIDAANHLATPPQSIDYLETRKTNRRPTSPRNSTFILSSSSQLASSIHLSPRRKSPTRQIYESTSPRQRSSVIRSSPTRSPIRSPIPSSSVHASPMQSSPSRYSPIRTPPISLTPMRVSPKRTPTEQDDLKLKSAETICTPGGSRKVNRFWQEIHGLNMRRESMLSASGKITKHIPISKRISTLQQNMKKSSSKWSCEDGFWSGTPVASSFNKRLVQAAKQPEERPKLSTNNIFDDEEEEEEEVVQETVMKKNNIPKIYPNVLAELKDRFNNKKYS